MDSPPSRALGGDCPEAPESPWRVGCANMNTMKKTLTIITGGLRGFAALANPGGGCRQAPSPTSPRKVKLEAGVRPLGEVTGTRCPPRNRRPRVPAARGAGDTASPGSSSETWGRLPRGPRGRDPSKKKSAPIFAKFFLQVGRDAGRCAAKTAGGYLPPPPSTAARSKCAKSRQLPWGTDTPGIATGTLGWISTKLAGDLPQTKAHLPRRRPVDAWLLRRAALAGVKCAKSRLGAAGRRRGLVDGETGCSPACLNPLGTLTKKSVMMDRVNPNHHHRGPPWIRRPREPWGRLPPGP